MTTYLPINNHYIDEVFVVKVGGNEVAASGGKDDTAYVFNINTGEMLFECSGVLNYLKFNFNFHFDFNLTSYFNNV